MIDETAVQYVAAVYGVTWVVAIAYIAILHRPSSAAWSASSTRSRASWSAADA